LSWYCSPDNVTVGVIFLYQEQQDIAVGTRKRAYHFWSPDGVRRRPQRAAAAVAAAPAAASTAAAAVAAAVVSIVGKVVVYN